MRMGYKSALLLISSLLIIDQAVASPPRVAPEPLVPYGAAPPVLDEKAEQRLNLLEKKMDSNVIYELLETLNQIKLEISELREIAEQQEHKMSLLTKRQRSLYQDVDRRMLELEAGSSSYKTTPPVDKTANSGYTSSGLSVNTTANSGLSNTEGTMGDPAQEQAAYTRAFNLLKEGNYSQAITAFREFLKSYGSGKYADNAQYWLGEANYATRDYKTALVEFQRILTDYQDSPKRKDAELKIGFTYYELKDWAASRRALESVVAQFPNTTNARTAKQRLERLTREGR